MSQPFGILGISFVLSLSLTVPIRYLSRHFGVIAKPGEKRWHTKETPILGGVAIYIAVVTSLLVVSDWSWTLLMLLAGGTLAAMEGLLDDVMGAGPVLKFTMLLVPAAIPIAMGFTVGFVTIHWLAVLLSFIWIVVLTNAFNYLDNMDGVAAGVAAITGGMIFLYFWLTQTSTLAGVAGLAVAGACIGFLVLNFPSAKIFMGDAGSMFIGYVLATAALVNDWQIPGGSPIFWMIPLLIMAVPIFDTSLVTVNRIIRRRSPFQGGRDHLSHRLRRAGFDEREVLAVIYVLTASVGLLGLLFQRATLTTQLVLLIVAFLSFATILASLWTLSGYNEDAGTKGLRGKSTRVTIAIVCSLLVMGLLISIVINDVI